MEESPAKRRRIETTILQNDNGNPETTSYTHGQPTTPTRASYFSPTKSSLARSYPHLASRSTRHSLSQSRGNALRKEILGKKPEVLSAGETVPRASPDRAAQKTAIESAPSLADENRAEETSIGARKEPGNGSDVESTAGSRSPLRERQQTHGNRPRPRVFSEEPGPAAVVPRLVQRADTTASAASRVGSNEPELPPTPVELGLSPIPERPRGLTSSSSPRGSKSGSGRRRQRTRSGAVVTSSPLKQKAQEVLPDNEAQESIPDAIDEAPESEPETSNGDMEGDGHTAEITEKQNTIRTLQERLLQLKAEKERLQAAVETKQDLDAEDLSLVSRISLENGAPQIQSAKSSDLDDSYLGYVTLFTPGSLQLNNRITTQSIQGRTKMIHCLTFTAPAPWLPNAFSCILEVVVDALDARVETLRMKDRNNGGRQTKPPQTEIHKWLNDRLEQPLHKLDVGGAVWGMGRWFAAAIERARIFSRLDKGFDEADETEAQDAKLTKERAAELACYLDMVQMQLSDPDSANAARHKKQRRVMLVWNIDLDWAGDVISDIQIATSGIPSEAESGLKSIFSTLVPTKGVMGAVDSIRKAIHGAGGELEAADTQQLKRKRT